MRAANAVPSNGTRTSDESGTQWDSLQNLFPGYDRNR